MGESRNTSVPLEQTDLTLESLRLLQQISQALLRDLDERGQEILQRCFSDLEDHIQTRVEIEWED